MRMKKEYSKKKRFAPKERHIRFNYTESPENGESLNGLIKLRYYFVVQDDRFRESAIEKILWNFQKKSIIHFPFEKIDKSEGKAVGTDYRYLYIAYDTFYSPTLLSFEGISKNVKRDSDLRDSTRRTAKEYVHRIYEKK